MTRRDYVVSELVNTERKYVQDLETLQGFKKLVEEKGEVPGDTIHAIFLNLNALLDFQRRFLIRIETMNSLPEEQQNWGQLFTQYHDAFRVYEPYIANQQNADEQAMREFDKLQKVGHRITNDRATLSGFLMKPFQRLSKYPLLLKVGHLTTLCFGVLLSSVALV
jgi:cell division control protein 24